MNTWQRMEKNWSNCASEMSWHLNPSSLQIIACPQHTHVDHYVDHCTDLSECLKGMTFTFPLTSLSCVCVSVCVCVCLQEVLGRGQILPYRSKRSMFAPSMSVTENQRPPFPRVIGQVTQTYTCALICVVVIGARRKSSAFCFALLSELALDSSCLFEQNVLSQRNKIAFLIV